MRLVGLTGSVASGKSEVARVWREAGLPVVGADDLAREAVRPGSSGLRAVVEAFGEEVLSSDGTLDRAGLRSRIFREPRARRRLEAILHPRISRLRDQWTRDRRAEGRDLAAAEIPLLFEVGLEGDFDEIVVVDAPRDVRLRRLVEDRGLDPEEAERMMEAQMEAEEKRRRADRVIVNDGTLDELRKRALEVLEEIREGNGDA